MTYCLALCLDEGLVFASDSRTNAGSDYVTTYGKTHVFPLGPDRFFVLLSAGNLATTQEVVNRLERDIAAADGRPSLATVPYLFEAADLVGGVSLDVQEHHDRGLRRTGVSGGVTLILGGQIRGEEPQIFLIYPEGNAITASDETPYLQIGESKYGKPILDRLANRSLSLADGARLALVSLDATAKSNVTVGMPFDVTLYRNGAYGVSASQRFGIDSTVYRAIDDTWKRGLQDTFAALADSVSGPDWLLG